MNFIHSREYLSAGQSVEVDCDTQCNVMLTDDSNYRSFQAGRNCTYYGGHRTHFPTALIPPHAGYWNITIDLGGGSANIRYSIRIVG